MISITQPLCLCENEQFNKKATNKKEINNDKKENIIADFSNLQSNNLNSDFIKNLLINNSNSPLYINNHQILQIFYKMLDINNIDHNKSFLYVFCGENKAYIEYQIVKQKFKFIITYNNHNIIAIENNQEIEETTLLQNEVIAENKPQKKELTLQQIIIIDILIIFSLIILTIIAIKLIRLIKIIFIMVIAIIITIIVFISIIITLITILTITIISILLVIKMILIINQFIQDILSNYMII